MNLTNKRGLSTIVITLILIVLSLVAVGIVWGVISNVLKSQSQQATSAFGQLFINLEIQNVNFKTNGEVDIVIQRNVGAGDLTAINFVVSDGTNSKVIKKDTALAELGTATFTLTSSEIQELAFVKEISIVPIINSNGNQVSGNVVDNFIDTSMIINDGWILVWQGLPTQARHLLHDGESINIAKNIHFNKIKFEGANINHFLIDSTSEIAVLQKTIPEYFNDVGIEPDLPAPRVKFHDLNGNKDVTLHNNYFMYGYGNLYRFMWACVDVSSSDYMYIGPGNGGCPPRNSFDSADVGCTSTGNNYCSAALDDSLKDSGLGLSKRQYQETKVWVKLE